MVGSHVKRSVHRGRNPEIEEEEEEDIIPDVVPATNMKTCPMHLWTNLRRLNPYHFAQRTFHLDPRFWTQSQFAMWNDHYDSSALDSFVTPHRLNSEHFRAHRKTDLFFVEQALKKMNLWTIANLEQEYCPDIVRQFFCAAYFHSGSRRQISWMTGDTPYTAAFDELAWSLGYDDVRRGGFRIHSESSKRMVAQDLLFCYPDLDMTVKTPPSHFTRMYYFYSTLARIHRATIVSKVGDPTACRGYHINLMYYSHPDRQRKIDVPDFFIYQELKRTVEKRFTANYAAFVQRFIEYTVPAEKRIGSYVPHATITLPLRGTTPDLPEMLGQPSEHGSKRLHDPTAASSSSSHPPKKGVAKFFKSLFSMCKHTYDVSHKSLTLSQDTRTFVVNDYRARGVSPPPDHPAMAPVAHFNYNMPPLDNEMFFGFGAFAEDADEEEGQDGGAPDDDDE
jgi:hypothetical protein